MISLIPWTESSIVLLFVDLSKVFDYTDHKLLLGRLEVSVDDKAIELF